MSSVAVIILTYNEEENLPFALRSVMGFADEVWVFDSFSTDRTEAIAREFGVNFKQHRFEDFGKQRNAALALPMASEWVLFLDADETISPELGEEIARTIATNPSENGFDINRRFFWMGSWVKRGYYPTWILRLFRRGKGVCEERSVNEHIIVDGTIGRLQHHLDHEDRTGVQRWIKKHLGYAEREAEELLRADHRGTADASLFGHQSNRKRWIKHNVWDKLPPLVRPGLYFSYRYIARGGFLDGKEALSYHILQALWFQTMVDLRYLEKKRGPSRD